MKQKKVVGIFIYEEWPLELFSRSKNHKDVLMNQVMV